MAIGDSLAVLCDGNEIRDTFPYEHASQFDQRPQLLCTNLAENRFVEEPYFDDERFADWSFQGLNSPVLFCMTDALGQWLLSWNDPTQSPIEIIRALKTPKEFSRFVKSERASSRMRPDDTTLLAIW